MLLSASEIERAISSGELLIEPFDANQLKPASYVMRLSNRWRRWRAVNEPVDLARSVDTNVFMSPIILSEECILASREFCLGATIERLSLPAHLAAFVAPLSHFARTGLNIGLGSFLVSPKFGSIAPTSLTLEIAVHSPLSVRLRAGLPICHVAFVRVAPETGPHPMDRSVYEGQETPSGPLLAEEWNR
jgi:dCTP deaminase